MWRLRAFTKHIEETVPAAMMGIMTLLVGTDVLGRYLFNRPIKGAGELSTMLFVWTVFLAASAALRRGLHVNVDLLIKHFPPRVRAAVALTVNSCLLIMVIVMGIMGWDYAFKAQTHRIHTFSLPYTWVLLAVPLSCFLMSLHLIKQVIQAGRGVLTCIYEPAKQGFDGTGCVMPQEDSGKEGAPP